MKKQLITLLGVAIFGFSSIAGATVYNFADEGDRLEMGYDGFDTGVTGGNPMPTGLRLGSSGFVYMDGSNNDGPAGAGVCNKLNGGGQCDPASDDNQSVGETMRVSSLTEATILELVFTGNHDPIVAGTTISLTTNLGGGPAIIDLSIAGTTVGDLTTLALAPGVTSLSYTVITGTTLVPDGEGDFFKVEVDGQLYLSAVKTSAVPLPAAVWLFGTALAGFVGFGRRRSVA